ncbi:hypothetical protein, partial [Priestia megaterium]|uniref:hypothetical protein n=1 Tax=Priestia megaterium TaxID=1404 RepID=UPI0035B65ECB
PRNNETLPMPLSATPRNTDTDHSRLAVPLAGLLLCALAGPVQAFGWQQSNQISAATGANATATYEIAKGLTYTLDSECHVVGGFNSTPVPRTTLPTGTLPTGTLPKQEVIL